MVIAKGGDLVKMKSGAWTIMTGEDTGVEVALLKPALGCMVTIKCFRGVTPEDIVEVYDSDDVSVCVLEQCLEGTVQPGLCKWRRS